MILRTREEVWASHAAPRAAFKIYYAALRALHLPIPQVWGGELVIRLDQRVSQLVSRS